MSASLRTQIEELETVMTASDVDTMKSKVTELLERLKTNLGPPPEKYSAKWLQELVAEKGYRNLNLRTCIICHTSIHYLFLDGEVYYDNSCSCGSFRSPPQKLSWQDLANTLAMQSTDDMRDSILARMGW